MTVKDIQTKMLSEISDTFDKSDGGFTYDVTKSVAVALNDQRNVAATTLDKMDVDNLTDDELERFAYQRAGIERKPATYATTQILLTGSVAAAVNVGDLVAADTVFYEILDDGVLDTNGQLYANVIAQEIGAAGNVPVGAINSFPQTLSGITSVINLAAVTNGYAAELDDDLRQRYYDKLQRPGKAGNGYHYREWALSVVGVGKVKVFPLWDGPLTVKVVIIDSNMEVPSADLLTSVENFINAEGPFGAIVTIAPAEALVIDLSATLILSEGLSVDDVKSAIEAKITTYLKSLVFEADYVSVAQIGRELLSVEGVLDYTNLLLNNDTANILIGTVQMPEIGTVILI
ncbi:MAG: baseplate J/gp47 family protein [Lysinibacillus sp.]